jgi:hypothetical protein
MVVRTIAVSRSLQYGLNSLMALHQGRCALGSLPSRVKPPESLLPAAPIDNAAVSMIENGFALESRQLQRISNLAQPRVDSFSEDAVRTRLPLALTLPSTFPFR